MSRALPVVAVAAVLAGAGPGCGGDSGGEEFKVRASTTMRATGISRARFLARVNDYCRKAWRKTLYYFSRYGRRKYGHLGRRERFAKTARLTLFSGLDFNIFDNIRFLGAPRGEARRVEAIIGPMQEAVERGQRLGPVYNGADVVRLFSLYNRRARAYGLDACVVSPARLRPFEEAL